MLSVELNGDLEIKQAYVVAQVQESFPIAKNVHVFNLDGIIIWQKDSMGILKSQSCKIPYLKVHLCPFSGFS